jgi:hypothetical protein
MTKALTRFDQSRSPTCPATRMSFLASITVAAMFQLMGNRAMSQQNCDVVKIANDYVRANFPFIDTNPDRRVVILSVGEYSQVTFHLPDRYLGFVPEITVDPQTCQVVSAKVWQ